ncbi:MAG: YdcF family protein [Bacteroidetes bacterium]|nr:YdcF family protein [Bacteroidota bacterium]
MALKIQNKRRWVWLGLPLLIFAILFICRISILIAIGRYLVADDTDFRSPWYAVLGGNSAERGQAAAWIYSTQADAQFLTTGGNRPSQLAAVGIYTFEAALTQKKMIQSGVDAEKIIALNSGTSSKEEAELLYQYCINHRIKQITIVSGQYHLRRLRRTFEPLFSEAGIQIKFFGAIEKDFDPDHWWESESGLIYTNNEYIKIMYYWLKY